MIDTDDSGEARDREKRLWRALDSYRSMELSATARLKHLRDDLGGLTASDLTYVGQSGLFPDDELLAPPWLAQFVRDLLLERDATRILYVDDSLGLLGGALAESQCFSLVDVVCRNSRAQDIYALLTSAVPQPIIGDFPRVAPQLAQSYDALVSFRRIGWPREQRTFVLGSGPINVRDGADALAILDGLSLLTSTGIILALVSPRFITDSSSNGVRQTLRAFGLSITGAFEIRPMALMRVGIPLTLAVIERTSTSYTFVAAVPDDNEARRQLIERFVARSDGPLPAQGRLVESASYRGLESLEAAETLRKLGERTGLRPLLFSDIVKEVNRPRRRRSGFERVEEHPNAVYLPEMAATPATTSQADLPERLKSYYQLIVDPDRVLPEYLAGMLNTPIGHATRQAAMVGGTIPRNQRSALESVSVYLPPLEIQRQIVAGLRDIRGQRSELSEIEVRLWTDPMNAPRRVNTIRTRDPKKQFQEWVEDLPFPLASILRAYMWIDQTDKEKYERLLHFFEALAAFTATVHLSAYRQEPSRWETTRKEITDQLARNSLSFERTTFGVWRTILNATAPMTRALVNGSDEDKRLCRTLYCAEDLEPIAAMSSKKLLSILEQTNTYRNRWPAHGGSVTKEEATQRLRAVENQVEELRKRFGSIFLGYELLEPLTTAVLPGPIYRYDALRVMGSNPLLERTIVELEHPVFSGYLCFLSPGNSRALQLEPVFQVQDAPQPACYFFNRMEGGNPRYVAYGLATVSELPDPTRSDAMRAIASDFVRATG